MLLEHLFNQVTRMRQNLNLFLIRNYVLKSRLDTDTRANFYLQENIMEVDDSENLLQPEDSDDTDPRRQNFPYLRRKSSAVLIEEVHFVKHSIQFSNYSILLSKFNRCNITFVIKQVQLDNDGWVTEPDFEKPKLKLKEEVYLLYSIFYIKLIIALKI